ncbi:MAG: BBP7 family outer membrane beta-barrel protein [Pirellulales bacterium]
MLSQLRTDNLTGLLFRCRFLAGLILALLATSSAFAQLRTGSNSRRLYKSEEAKQVQSDEYTEEDSTTEQPAVAKSSGKKSPVVPASHSKVVQSKAVSTSVAPSAVKRASTSQVQLAGCTSCGSGISSGSVIDTESPMMEGAMEGYLDSGCGCGSCGGCNSCCDDMCCEPACGPLQSLLMRLSFRAEAPLFWRRPQSTPPLVTTAPDATDSATAGRLGQAATQILRGGTFDDGVHAGARFTVSTWLDPQQYKGLSFRYWNAGTFNNTDTFDSANFPILARPITNTTTGTATADTQLVAYPGQSTGSITISSQSKLYGMDLLVNHMAYADRFTRFDWVYGYHHTLIGERISIASQTTVTGNVGGLQGANISVNDDFRTLNRYHGFAMGFQSNRRIGLFNLEPTFKLIAGNLERQVAISGGTTTVSGGTTTQTTQGLLARNTNIRSITSNTFALAPEVGLNLAYAIGPNLDFTIGYNYLMIPKVAQAGRQIDRNLRVNLSDPLTGSQDPGFPFATSRYWVRSLGLGAQLRY